MKPLQKLFWVYTVIIPLLAVLPLNGTNSRLNNTYIISIRLDYLLHVGIFTLWLILYRVAYFSTKTNYRRGETVKLISLFLLFAILSEVIQSFIPYRSFNLNDLIANFLGVIIGLLILFVKPGNVSGKMAADHHG